MKYSLSPLNHIFKTFEGETVLFSGLTNNLQEKLEKFEKETNVFMDEEINTLCEKGILIERPSLT